MGGRVVLEIPGEPSSRVLEIDDGETLRVGRDPALVGSPAATSRMVAVKSPSVSASHVTVHRSPEGTVVVDERSRNGTWARLPPGDPVLFRTEQPVTIRLGSAGRSETGEERPADAVWTGRGDFHLAVVRAITEWFERQRVAARVGALPRTEPSDRDLVGLIPLANGFDLSVVPLRTMDHRWERMAEILWSYTSAQNRIFTTEENTRGEGMILVSPAIRRVHQRVVEAAQRGVRVLLCGETGSGKDGMARCYHRNSGRAGAFISRNCSMFSREFLRTELFGAEKGSYTGATRTIIGAVERAHGGTLFLDEIRELPADVQAMLLTFLDNGEYERFGANGQVRKADVRIVSATNRDLRSAIEERRFREDLWYRIAGQVIDVPALCDRPEDVEAYLQLTRLANGLSLYEALTPSARQWLLGYRWAGNFRELRGFADRAPGTAARESIGVEACETILRPGASTPPVAAAASASPVRGAGNFSKADLAGLAGLAGAAFRADLAHDLNVWDDVKQYVESYLKPLLFAALSGIADGRHVDADIAAIAHAIEADRGTVRKQLARFIERFVPGSPKDE